MHSMMAYGLGVVFRCSKPMSISTEEPASLASDFADLHEDGPDFVVRVVLDEWVVQERCWLVCVAVYEDHGSNLSCVLYFVCVAGKEKTVVGKG